MRVFELMFSKETGARSVAGASDDVCIHSILRQQYIDRRAFNEEAMFGDAKTRHAAFPD